MWVSECAKAKHRGRLVLLEGWFAIGGIVIATWIEFGLFYVNEQLGQLALPDSVPGSIRYCRHQYRPCFLPESPRWLVKKDRFEEATSRPSPPRWSKPGFGASRSGYRPHPAVYSRRTCRPFEISIWHDRESPPASDDLGHCSQHTGPDDRRQHCYILLD